MTDTATTAQQAAPGASSSGGGRKGEVYIGHEKNDYEGRRTGVKGRIIIDDPSKYPSRENDVTGERGSERAYGTVCVGGKGGERARQPLGSCKFLTLPLAHLDPRRAGGWAGGEAGLKSFIAVSGASG